MVFLIALKWCFVPHLMVHSYKSCEDLQKENPEREVLSFFHSDINSISYKRVKEGDLINLFFKGGVSMGSQVSMKDYSAFKNSFTTYYFIPCFGVIKMKEWCTRSLTSNDCQKCKKVRNVRRDHSYLEHFICRVIILQKWSVWEW